ncbi:RNA polymerase sigma-70 factor [uncultured Bacteroides sp.]|uniref:RNA polymerase sigma-70 factor n=1 Tax=uncultured Bacteroides sp. TaxID=162156 RepID=UPI002AAC0DBF|nr:RNA polymerase sigma-70 factor [uncultured Bacteroides sp.]
MSIHEPNALLFNQVFADYQHRFILFAKTYLHDKSLAEDIVMDSFMYYWENRASLASDSNIPAYVLTIIKHKCLNHLRSKIVREKVEEELFSHNSRVLQTHIETLEACNPQELFSKEVHLLINQALATLPNRTKDIFLRSRFQNQTYKEIATDLNITVKSVEFEISKAMKILRIALKDYFPLMLLLLHCKWPN